MVQTGYKMGDILEVVGSDRMDVLCAGYVVATLHDQSSDPLKDVRHEIMGDHGDDPRIRRILLERLNDVARNVYAVTGNEDLAKRYGL